MWDGVTEIYVNKYENFAKEFNLQDAIWLKTLQENYLNLWYVEVDENLIVLPNRDLCPILLCSYMFKVLVVTKNNNHS